MSIIRPLLRLGPARILIGLAAALMVAALVPAAAGAGASKHHLVFRLSGPANQNVIGARSIAILVHCPSEACTVEASATSTSPSIRTAKIHARVPAGGSERLSLPLAARESGKLKSALKAGKTPTLTVHATAKDRSGNSVPLTLTVRPTKP